MTAKGNDNSAKHLPVSQPATKQSLKCIYTKFTDMQSTGLHWTSILSTDLSVLMSMQLCPFLGWQDNLTNKIKIHYHRTLERI